jgi:hypothetical protein
MVIQTPSSLRASRSLGILILCVTVLLGCGSSSSSSSGGGGGGGGDYIPTAAEVDAAMSLTDLADPTVTVNGPVRLYQYSGAKVGEMVMIRLETEASFNHDSFESMRKSLESQLKMTTTTVPNLGDDAFSYPLGIMVLKGTTTLQIGASMGDAGGLQRLAESMVGKL